MFLKYNGIILQKAISESLLVELDEYQVQIFTNGVENNNMKDLVGLVKLSILLNGKQNIAKKTGLTIPTINRIFEPDANITINTLNNLIDALDLRYNISFIN